MDFSRLPKLPDDLAGESLPPFFFLSASVRRAGERRRREREARGTLQKTAERERERKRERERERDGHRWEFRYPTPEGMLFGPAEKLAEQLRVGAKHLDGPWEPPTE